MTVLKIENVSKQYRLGQVGTGTLSHDLKRSWYLARGKEDPFAKVGAENDRAVAGGNYVWALKDINFEVQQGEVLGIIGKNGAGKSTLLKLLSQITHPTIGNIRVKGRIASLLEVGTGFHPELTGRENIFLNGAILGMTRSDVRRKLDEIVEFAGVAKYLDTPTKRYSSGMTVRLGFAIAAHLEPEILVVDEVLAVGDAEFQKKAIGKMQDVSKSGGRTVLFVSHNMTSIRTLCNRVLMISNGKVHSSGDANEIISNYLKINRIDDGEVDFKIPPYLSLYTTGEAKFKKVKILNSKNEPTRKLFFKENFSVEVELSNFVNLENIIINIFLLNAYGDKVLTFSSTENFKPMNLQKGNYSLSLPVNLPLMPGEFSFCLAIIHYGSGNSIDYIESVLPFEVSKESRNGDFGYPWTTLNGYVYPNQVIEIN